MLKVKGLFSSGQHCGATKTERVQDKEKQEEPTQINALFLGQQELAVRGPREDAGLLTLAFNF